MQPSIKVPLTQPDFRNKSWDIFTMQKCLLGVVHKNIILKIFCFTCYTKMFCCFCNVLLIVLKKHSILRGMCITFILFGSHRRRLLLNEAISIFIETNCPSTQSQALSGPFMKYRVSHTVSVDNGSRTMAGNVTTLLPCRLIVGFDPAWKMSINFSQCLCIGINFS